MTVNYGQFSQFNNKKNRKQIKHIACAQPIWRTKVEKEKPTSENVCVSRKDVWMG